MLLGTLRKVIISWVGFGKHIFSGGISVQTYHLQTVSTCNRVNMCTMEHCNILTSHDRSDFDTLAIATPYYVIWNIAHVWYLQILGTHIFYDSILV